MTDFIKNYHELIGLDLVEGSDEFRQTIEKIKDENALLFARFKNVKLINKYINVMENQYNCICIRCDYQGVEITVGYFYWSIEKDIETPAYVCIGHTYDSMDGEYRFAFFRFEMLDQIVLSRDMAELKELELELAHLVSTGKIKFSYKSYSESVKNIKFLTNHGMGLRSLILFFIISYRKIVFKYSSAVHRKFLQKFKKILIKYESIILGIQSGEHFNIAKCNMLLGQKVVPFTVNEVSNTFDCRFGIWRELLITQKVGDFIVNNIAPCVSYYNQWFVSLCYNSDIYDNKNLKKRYDRSKKAKKYGDNLFIVGTEIKEQNNDVEGVDDIASTINQCITHINTYLLLSDLVMVHTSEYGGKTLREEAGDYCARPNTAKREWILESDHLFCAAYTLYCLHTKLGICHTDLHTNNIVINRNNYIEDITPENAHVAFIAGPQGDSDTFLVPNKKGTYVNIIDYGRALMGLTTQHMIRDTTDVAMFFEDQFIRVEIILGVYLSDDFMKEYYTRLKKPMKEHFDVFFGILCFVDYIALARVFDQIYDMYEVTRTHANYMEELATRTFKENIIKFIEGNLSLADNGLDLLKTVFSEHLFKNVKDKSNIRIMDIYNHNNPLKWSAYDYDKYPPWMQIEKFKDKIVGPATNLKGAKDYEEAMAKLEVLKNRTDSSLRLKQKIKCDDKMQLGQFMRYEPVNV